MRRRRQLFPRLRGRLLASHALIVLLTLGMIALSLYIFLDARQEAGNLNRSEIDAQLADFLRQEVQPLVEIGAAPTLRQQRVLSRVVTGVRLFRQFEVRLLVVNQDQQILYDTRRAAAGNLDGKPLPVITAAVYDEPSTSSQNTSPLIHGDFRSPEGQVWMFVGEQPSSRSAALIVAVRSLNDTRILSVILEEYGDYLRTPLIQAAIMGLFTALLLSIIISRSVSRPLQKVAEAATAAAGGDLNRRAPVQGPLEVRTVADSFNLMTEEVAQAQQTQREFLANVSHDLRTPLTSIQGFSQAIMDGVASDPAAAQRAAQIIHDEAGRLNRMVQELLDLAKIEAGRLTMARMPIKLHDLLRGIAERLTYRANEKDVILSITVPTLPAIAGDGDRLVQVFTNLLDNAIKHTPSGGKVSITAAAQDNGVTVKIGDTGEGIPAADLPRIFDRFYQVDKSRQRREGFGLGLAITKQIVEAHGGKISAESVEGLGTVFSVWLPTHGHGESNAASGSGKRK